MRTLHFSKLMLCATSVIALTGCIDESYDLSDMDKSMEMKVNNLTLPISIDPIEFGDMVDLSKEESIKTEENGDYSYEKKGGFGSETFTLSAFAAAPKVSTFSVGGYKIGKGVPAGKTLSFNAETSSENAQQFNLEYSYNKVDKSIYDITAANVTMDINVEVTCGDCNVKYDELTLVMPVGATGTVKHEQGKLQQNGNVLTFTDVEAPNGTFAFTYSVEKLDFIKAGGKIDNPKNGSPASFTLNGNYIALKSVSITTQAEVTKDALFKANFKLGKIQIKSITGTIKYDIDNFALICLIDQVPDELTGDDTKIAFVNPTLALTICNPLGIYGSAQAQLNIEQIRDNEADFLPTSARNVVSDVVLPNGKKETTIMFYGASKPANSTADLNIKVNNFSNILFGKGLPKELKVTFPDVISNVVDLPLGTGTLFSLWGDYAFNAPLNLTNSSHISYSHRQDDWVLSGYDNITISKMVVDADIESTLPVDVHVDASPIQRSLLKNGFDGVNQNVKVTGANINTGNHHVKIVIDAPRGIEVSDLMGLDYKMSVNADGKGSINKNQGLKFKNLKVTVSGKYTSKD